MAHNAARHVQARAIAEDGLGLVIERMRQDPEWRESQTHGVWSDWIDLNGGRFRVQAVDEEDGDLRNDPAQPLLLRAEGSYRGVVHRVSNQVTPTAVADTTVLLVTGNAYHADEDLERIAALESWGYRVLTVADSDPLSAYEAVADQADVIYVSEEAASGSVGTKCNGLGLGIVNEEQALQDELGMSTGGGDYRGNAIDIVDNTHPVTLGFPTGRLQITTGTTGLIQSSGTPAAGLTTLAERVSSSTRTLTVLDVGDAMTDGRPSPQRRVTLPFGSNAFEYGLLNDDGRQLMKQAIEWAKRSVVSLDPVHRWTLDESSGVSAEDLVGDADGTLVGGPTLGAAGPVGSAMTFDDSLDRVTLPTDTLDGRGDVTISMWFRTAATQQQSLLSGARSGNNNAQLIFLYSPTKLRYYHGTSSGGFLNWDLPAVNTDQWHHLALVRDQSGGRVTLYLDGQSRGYRTTSLSTIDVEHLVLAEEQDRVDGGYVSWQSFLGGLDDVRFYDRVLTAEQIADLYNGSTLREDEPALVTLYEFEEPDPVVPNLVGHWKLDEPTHQPILLTAGRYSMTGSGRVDAYDSGDGPYDPAKPKKAYVLNHMPGGGSDVLDVRHRTQFYGLIALAPDTTADDRQVRDQAEITGGLTRWMDPVAWSMPAAPTDRPRNIHTINGTHETWTSDRKVKKLNIRNGGTLTIDGDLTLEAMTDGVEIKGTGSELIIPPGSSLTIHAQRAFKVYDNARVNADSRAADRLTLYLHGVNSRLNGGAVMAARMYTANGFSFSDGGTFYGSVFSKSEVSVGSDSFHLDQGSSEVPAVFAENEVGQAPGFYRGGAAAGGVGWGDGGTAAEFDGGSGFIEVGHNPAYLLDEASVSFWFRADRFAGSQGLVSKDAVGFGDGGHLRIALDGGLLKAQLQSRSQTHELSTSRVSVGTWHHVVLGMGQQGMRLYLDGMLVASNDYVGGLGTTSGGSGNAEPWVFGADLATSDAGSSDNGSNPFDGRIDDVRVYDFNLDAGQAANLAAGVRPGSASSAVVEDVAGGDAPLDLFIADPDRVSWHAGGGLTLNQPTSAASPTAAAGLHAALTATDQFTVEVEFTPANLTQTGPARLIAYSGGSTSRNFLVGQAATHWGAMARTAYNGSGGPQVMTDTDLVAGVRQHVILTYDGRELRLYRNGLLEAVEEWTGSLDNWIGSHRLILGDEIGGGRSWLGTYHRVAVWDRAVNTVQADNLFNGNPPGPADGGEGGFRYAVEWIEGP
jgi:hypothetical protein